MTKMPNFRTWGDADLDRLWREMYEAEKVLNDMDYLNDTPALKKAVEATERFLKQCEIVEQQKWVQNL